MQDFINQATAKWLDLLPVGDVYADGASWMLKAAVIDLDILCATDVYFRIDIAGDSTSVTISVYNDKEVYFTFQSATMQTAHLYDTLSMYGDSIPAAIKQYHQSRA